MRNVYIDLGCYDGDSVEQFRNWCKIAFDPEWEWQIFAFDPNPRFRESWERKTGRGTKFQSKAAWIHDGEIEFAVDGTENPLGSTVMPGKKSIWDHFEKITVPCFDFSEFLKAFHDAFVVVKMDIEGAEFPILEKMIQDGTIKIPALLAVEFHPNKVVEYSTTDKIDLIDRIKPFCPRLVEWH